MRQVTDIAGWTVQVTSHCVTNMIGDAMIVMIGCPLMKTIMVSEMMVAMASLLKTEVRTGTNWPFVAVTKIGRMSPMAFHTPHSRGNSSYPAAPTSRTSSTS